MSGIKSVQSIGNSSRLRFLLDFAIIRQNLRCSRSVLGVIKTQFSFLRGQRRDLIEKLVCKLSGFEAFALSVNAFDRFFDGADEEAKKKRSVEHYTTEAINRKRNLNKSITNDSRNEA